MKGLFIGGFGWTGSGALIDCIADYDEVGFIRKDREETSFLKGMYSLSNVYRKLRAGTVVEGAFIEKVFYYLRGTPGSADEVEPKRERPNIKRNEQLRYFFGEDLDRCILELQTDVDKLVDKNGNLEQCHEEFLLLCKKFFDEFRLRSVEKQYEDVTHLRYVVTNNDPSAYACDLFEFHSCEMFTIVLRGYKDVLADLVRLSKMTIDPVALDGFIRSHTKKMNEFKAKLKSCNADILRKICIVTFEDFVTDSELRDKWVQKIGLNPANSRRRYDAGESMKNIGIFNEYLDPSVSYARVDELEIARIEMLKELRSEYGTQLFLY